MKAEFFLTQIRQEFPQLKWNKHVDSTNGWDHYVFILDDKVVFRIPKDKEYEDKLNDEIQLLSYLAKKVRVNIPVYKYISKKKSLAGYPIVTGRVLKPSIFKRLTASEKEKIAKQIAGFLSTLHTTPKSIIKKYDVEHINQENEYKDLVRKTKKFLFPRLRTDEIEQIKEYFVQLKAALGHKYSNALTHNDFSHEHILWDSTKKKIGVIDFSDRAFADPASDFFSLCEYGDKFLEQVYHLYTGKKDKHFLERSQLYFKRIPLSLMIHGLTDKNCTFEEGYEMFKKRFKIAKIS
jgi:aminoglycoside phosphotransferase (APT) family kinase protein